MPVSALIHGLLDLKLAAAGNKPGVLVPHPCEEATGGWRQEETANGDTGG